MTEDEGTSNAPANDAIPTFTLLWYATLGGAVTQRQLVKGLLLASSLFVVYGESNSGKTFWILDLALHLAAGLDWRGRRVERGLVLYVAGEGSASVRNRVAAVRQQRADIAAGIPFAILPQAVNFMGSAAVDRLIAIIRAAESECGDRIALVVIDTLNRAMFGADENSSEAMGTVIAGADRIRTDTGAAVGFVHHTGKDAAKGARGHSSLRAAVDTEILIEGQLGTRTATVTKQRDLESELAMPFELVATQIGTDADDASPITSCVVKHMDSQVSAAPYSRELRGKAQRQFVTALRIRTQSEADRIWSLADLRQVGREIGLSKGTARSVVDAVTVSPYMQATAFGYRFTDGRVEG